VGHVQSVRLAAEHEEDVDMLVDTGATYSLISPALADRLAMPFRARPR
jgi:predicted aspartyl protease